MNEMKRLPLMVTTAMRLIAGPPGDEPHGATVNYINFGSFLCLPKPQLHELQNERENNGTHLPRSAFSEHHLIQVEYLRQC